ncbi:MAG: hypothetical protein K2Q18_09995, partial [Bdellovibrionales bacterium]|nr:hypothetical protein [Bdellovibrionales bacterium]
SLTTPASNTLGFSVGGSYLSGSKAGRFTSDLYPLATTRKDVGMRCIIPITAYPSDSKHTYNYTP